MKKVFIGVFSASLLTASIVFPTSCKHEVLPTVNAADICFERDVLPIFVSNCAMSGCHDSKTREEGYELTNYATITSKGIKPGNPNDSKIWESIDEGEMPPNNSLTAEQKAIIKTWIADGAKNGVGCVSNCDSTVYTYSGAISGIITTYCKGCHTNPGASANLDLNSYSNVKAAAESGKLLNSVMGTNAYTIMPPSGNKLSDCQITQIKKWITNGYPN
jgi:hypothetical protein